MLSIAAGSLAGLLLGGAVVWFLVRRTARLGLGKTRGEAEALLRRSRREAEEARRKALLVGRDEAESLRDPERFKRAPVVHRIARRDTREPGVDGGFDHDSAIDVTRWALWQLLR